MRALLLLALFTLFFSLPGYSQAPAASRSQALNHYVDLINHSVEEAEGIVKALEPYYEEVQRQKGHKADFIRPLAPSGALEQYHYKKAFGRHAALSEAESKQLNEQATNVWKALNELDEQYKALEIYLRLGDYKQDNFKRSDELLAAIGQKLSSFRKVQEQLVQLVEQTYQGAKASGDNVYARTEKGMKAVLKNEKELLSLWKYNFHEATPTNWPVIQVQQNVNANENILPTYSKAPAGIEYPASSMYASFGEALASLQRVKRDAIDGNNHQARQSSRHGNQFYKELINYYNNDLLATYNQFVGYSNQQGHHLLLGAKFCPGFEITQETQAPTQATVLYSDTPIPSLQLSSQKAPIPPPAFTALSLCVDFINESLRKVMYLQTILRNYQSSTGYYKTLTSFTGHGGLSYSHEEFTIPHSYYQQAKQSLAQLPKAYQVSLASQLEALLRLQQEMEVLSIELSAYTQGKAYEKDRFFRSDEVLQRYAFLFEVFDVRKERLYTDARRIFESYPSAQPTSPWYVSGQALLQTLDHDHAALTGVKLFLTGKAKELPPTEKIEKTARTLIEKEYQQMNGLKRYGRSNGLCPYTPYEDLAEDSRRFGEKVSGLKARAGKSNTELYEDYIYFYNNELVYAYNKFCELSEVKLLKQVNQPFLFAYIQTTTQQLADKPAASPKAQPATTPENPPTTASAPQRSPTQVIRDTVYIERTRVDTVYLNNPTDNSNFWSLEGYAYNNLVLLLDVSASMNAPHKLPLLKKSMRRLLQLMRAEDEISIVVYSGKAKVLLEPTSGREKEKISQLIDKLESDGNTDANGGIKLAYKVADRNYIRGGNNRIVLATDGEFSISPDIFSLVENNARQDIYLSVFDFNAKTTAAHILQQLARQGKGHFEDITPQNSDVKLVLEAKGKRAK